MKQRCRARPTLPLLLALFGAPALAEPFTYVFDPERSFVHFELLHFGTSTIRGRFGPLTGAVTIDRDAQRGELSLALPTTTVSTGLAVFDARIRQADLLASQAFPEAYFVAAKFSFSQGQPAEIRGEFTLRGQSRPLSLRALRFACRTEGRAEVCGGDFEAEILRSEFGLTFGLPFVADRVRLLVQVQGRR